MIKLFGLMVEYIHLESVNCSCLMLFLIFISVIVRVVWTFTLSSFLLSLLFSSAFQIAANSVRLFFFYCCSVARAYMRCTQTHTHTHKHYAHIVHCTSLAILMNDTTHLLFSPPLITFLCPPHVLLFSFAIQPILISPLLDNIIVLVQYILPTSSIRFFIFRFFVYPKCLVGNGWLVSTLYQCTHSMTPYTIK